MLASRGLENQFRIINNLNFYEKTLNVERKQSVQSLYLNLLEETENMRFLVILGK